MTACPVVGTHGIFSDYECIDTEHDLQSCGGCPSTGSGRDCTAIRGAWNVGCERGHCAGAFTIFVFLRISWPDRVTTSLQFTIAWPASDLQEMALPASLLITGIKVMVRTADNFYPRTLH